MPADRLVAPGLVVEQGEVRVMGALVQVDTPTALVVEIDLSVKDAEVWGYDGQRVIVCPINKLPDEAYTRIWPDWRRKWRVFAEVAGSLLVVCWYKPLPRREATDSR